MDKINKWADVWWVRNKYHTPIPVHFSQVQELDDEDMEKLKKGSVLGLRDAEGNESFLIYKKFKEELEK